MDELLKEIQRILAVQDEVLRNGLIRTDEKLLHLVDLQTEVVQHVATLAETGRQNMWLNRLLVGALIVLAGAEKVLGWITP